jgi:heptaprenylglyceryl phosphate synthase
MSVYNYINSTIEKKGAGFFVLIDPDKTFGPRLEKFVLMFANQAV